MCVRNAVAGASHVAYKGDHDEELGSTARLRRMTANERSSHYDGSTPHLCSRELHDSANFSKKMRSSHVCITCRRNTLKSGPHAYTELFTSICKHVRHTIGQAPTPPLDVSIRQCLHFVHICFLTYILYTFALHMQLTSRLFLRLSHQSCAV